MFVVSQEKVQGDAHDIEFLGSKVSVEDGLVRSSGGNNKGPWMEDSHELKSCWSLSQSGTIWLETILRLAQFLSISLLFFFTWFALTMFLVFADEALSSKGYVTFSLTNGPEYHVSQV